MTTTTIVPPASLATGVDNDAVLDAAVAVVEAEYRPPRYRHITLSNGEVVAELIEG